MPKYYKGKEIEKIYQKEAILFLIKQEGEYFYVFENMVCDTKEDSIIAFIREKVNLSLIDLINIHELKYPNNTEGIALNKYLEELNESINNIDDNQEIFDVIYSGIELLNQRGVNVTEFFKDCLIENIKRKYSDGYHHDEEGEENENN